MSPEQALGKRMVIDHRTDVYSLGATLYELLTLRPVFGAADRQELLRQIAFEEPTAPRRMNKAIPAELETVVLKAVEKKPADRYATAQELADDLRHWLEDKPIRARRPTLVQRAGRWARRHRPLVTGAVAALLVGLTVLAGSLGWAARDRAARRGQNTQVVLAALREADFWQQQRRLPEALSAARRAEGLLAGADADETVRARVRARLADLELLDRLETIRLEKQTAVVNGHFDWQAADDLYREAFRDAGLDVETLPLEEAVERLRKSTVATELAGMLDHWALVRRSARGAQDTTCGHLQRIAHQADADAARKRVREALAGGDLKTLRALAASEETLQLPVATLSVLARSLIDDTEVGSPAEAFLREAQRRHPNDFWLNHMLFMHFMAMPPPARQQAIRFAAVAVGLRPASAGAHFNLGAALKDNGQVEEAIAEFREALRLKRDYAEAHRNLGTALGEQGKTDEAIAECREAIRIKKDDSGAHNNLGVMLWKKGQLDAAIAECQEAIRISKTNAEAHNSLGVALLGKGRLAEAIAEFREALSLQKDFPEAHLNLGSALLVQGQLDQAIVEFRKALLLNKDLPMGHNNLGNALRGKGQLDEAIAEFREALRLKGDLADAHCSLGDALLRQGHFQQAVQELRLGRELGSRNPQWPSAALSALRLRDAEHLANLDTRLPALLEGKEQPKHTAERVDLARLCQEHKKLYAAAARWFGEAFAAQPTLVDDPKAGHRYNAACAAALAGCGEGKDAEHLDDKKRADLRRQALDWLRADLTTWSRILARDGAKARPVVVEKLQHWLVDPDFARVRGETALAALPEKERPAWQQLWADVANLLAQAQAHAPPDKKPVGK
jgi:serine/threonine-protein kinase